MSSLCDYSDPYVLVKGTISIAEQAGDNPNNNNKEVVFKTCAPFADCISKINNTQIDNAKDIDVVMPIYNLIENSDNYLKNSGSLWQHYRDGSFLDANGGIAYFPAANNNSAALFKLKQKIAGEIAYNGRNDVEIMVPLKYLSNFLRIFEMLLVNCEINVILTCSGTCVLSNDAKATTFAVTDTTLYVPIVTLSTQDNVKLLQQLKSGFKRTISWNKYQSKVTIQMPNPHLDYLIDPSFQEGVNRLFVLLFENTTNRIVHTNIIFQL